MREAQRPRFHATLIWHYHSLDFLPGAEPGKTPQAGHKLLYLFENYVLDTERRELRCGSSPVAVQPQVFDLLEHLIRNRERVVSKDDLIADIWGGRIVSESALTTRINAARSAIGDSGAEQRLIKTLPRKGVRFAAIVREQQTSDPVGSPEAPSSGPRDRPSIAVLPFINLSGDPAQEYFADGMVDEIITSLSRIKWLVVTARTSTFVFKGQNTDIREIASKLGVRYVLEGSVRKAGHHIRIIGQLIDANSGGHIWADRIDGRIEDVFDVQDRITGSVVAAIEPRLLQAEIERAKRKRPGNVDAYDCYLRALPSSYRPTPENCAEALRLLENGLTLDPHYAPANVMAAWLYFYRVAATWSTSPQEDRSKVARLARAAIDYAEDDPHVLCLGGFLLSTVERNADIGLKATNRALEVSPNSAYVLQHAGWTLTLAGDQDRAVEYFNASVQLNPSDPLTYRALTGAMAASILAGRYPDAVAFGEKARFHYSKWGPTFRFLAAAYAQLGQDDKAAEALANLFKLEPSVTISHLQSFLPYRDLAQAERVWDGLRKAGMPEG
jgi:TolB-like protein/tetratricopeptide (TPR) repeat protein